MVVGGGGWVVYSEFSVLLWSKALVLDLDQAEQNPLQGLQVTIILMTQENLGVFF